MSRSTRSRLITVLYFVLLIGILVVPSIVTAQGPVGPPGLGGGPAAAAEGPAQMRFRPDAAASNMQDFRPEGANMVGVAGSPGNQVVANLVPGKDNLIRLADDKVGVLIEDGTVGGRPAELRFRDVPLPAVDPEAPDNAWWSERLLHFEVAIHDRGNGGEIRDWDTQSRIVVDLRSLITPEDAQSGNFFLMYRDEEDPNVWHHVDIDIHQEAGLISAEVPHFSEWAAGISAERWTPSFVEPNVNTFSGAASYSYPIQVPAGKGGLQPAISLSYSSRALDGRIQDIEDAGPIADGWSIADISIIREDTGVENCSGALRMIHPESFRLSLNGAGHKLTQAPGGSSTKWGGTRYYAEDAPGLYIERLNHPTGHTTSTPRYYWGVITPEGTIYRMGYDTRSESYHTAPSGRMRTSSCSGTVVTRSGYSWRADEVTDVHGNKNYYDYLTKSSGDNIDNSQPASGTTWVLTTVKTRIYEITYNMDGSTPLSKIVFLAKTGDNHTAFTFQNHLRVVYVFENGDTSPIREYRLDTTTHTVNSTSCLDYSTVPASPLGSTTRVLDSIQVLVGTDNNPNSNDVPAVSGSNGIFALPKTTFTHAQKAHFYKNSLPCFTFYYLTEVDNGYGGSFEFAYKSDERSVGTHGNGSWPSIGYSFVVETFTRDDGQGTALDTLYHYYKPCYNQQWGPSVPAFEGEISCQEGSNPPTNYGSLTGFQRVTITRTNSSSAAINVSKHYFYQTTDLMGKSDEVEQYKANGTTLTSEVTNTYTTETVAGTYKFSYLDEVVKVQHESGGTITTKQEFGYNTGLQGSAQRGNRTVVWDHGNTAYTDDDRTIITCYYPADNMNGTDNWIVGLPAIQRVFDGLEPYTGISDRCDTDHTDDLISETRTIYDFDLTSGTPTYNDYTSEPELGLVTTTFTGKYGDTTLDGATNGFIRGQTFEYDSDGNPDTITNENGLETSVTYDSTLNMFPVSVTVNNTDISAQTTTYNFYGINGVTDEANGFQMPLGAVRKIVDPNGQYMVHEYDPFGRLHASYELETDRGSNSNAWDGDPAARYRYWDNTWNSSMYSNWIADPMSVSEEVRPDTFEPTTSVGAGEVSTLATHFYYDGFGRQIQSRDLYHSVAGLSGDQDLVTLIGYDDNGQANCQSVSYAVARSSGIVTTACTSKPHTATDFDDIGRPTSVTGPDGNSTDTAYDVVTHPFGLGGKVQEVEVIDARGHRRDSLTNAQGQLLQVIDYSGNTPGTHAQYGKVNYDYDLVGNLTQVETVDVGASRTLTTTITYDVLGRKVSMDDPDMGAWDYTYDADGNLIQQKDALNQYLCFYYDSLGRMKAKSHNTTTCLTTVPTSSDANWLATYTYDTGGAGANALGQLTRVDWDRGTAVDYETFTFDSKGRPYVHTRVIQGDSYVVTNSTYDILHRPTVVNNAYGENITLTYDREGLNTLKAGSNNIVTGVTFNERSQMEVMSFQNGVDTTYLYYGSTDNFRLKQMQVEDGIDLRLAFNYSYDAVGNIDQILEYSSLFGGKGGTPVTVDTQTFAYDELNRLIDAEGDRTGGSTYDYDLVYEYDAFGNITKITEDSVARTYSYDYVGTSNPPHAVESITGGYSFDYDANGNMFDRDDASGDYTQDFDKENRLIEVTDDVSGDTTTFYYDANGQRTITVFDDGSSTETTHYPFPDLTVEDPGGANEVERVTYHFGAQAVAVRVDDGSPVLSYLHTDHLGSTSIATDGTGSSILTSRASYLPFGEERQVSTADLNDRGFTGHIENRDIGLTYMNARFYAPNTNRMVTADTIIPSPGNSQAYNRYSYVYNNPIRYLDPTGHCGADATGEATNDQAMLDACNFLRDQLQDLYGISITGLWRLYEMRTLELAFDDIVAGFGNAGRVKSVYSGTVIERLDEEGQAEVSVPANVVKVRNGTFSSTRGQDSSRFILIHELGHRLDMTSGLEFSEALENETGGTTTITGTDTTCPAELITLVGACSYTPGFGEPSRYSRESRREDFADSFARHLFGGNFANVVADDTHRVFDSPLTVTRTQIVTAAITVSYVRANPPGNGTGSAR